VVVGLVIIVSAMVGSAMFLSSALAAPAAPAGCHADGTCGGLTIRFHTAGVDHSPSPLWAGRWWFIDEQGVARQGSCIFHQGVHPTYTSPAHRVPLRLPLDPRHELTDYLTWRYGTSADPLTSAALWAVLHHYALDAAGASRASVPSTPLVARLDRIAAMTGRRDVQQRAIALDREARAMLGPWTVTARFDRASTSATVVVVQVHAGRRPVPDVPVSVLVSGRDAPLAAATGADGTFRRRVPLPATPGMVTVVALVTMPGHAEAYRGVPALPSVLGSQTLVTAGPPRRVRITTTLLVPTTTTTTTTTTTISTTTPVPPTTTTTTTTVPHTTTTTTVPTTTVPMTTVPPTTTAHSTTTTRPRTTVPATAPTTIAPTFAPTTAAALPPPLPRTGGRPDGGIALLATALLVGGVGVMGTLRRGHLHSGG
jgi:hypothetical protein